MMKCLECGLHWTPLGGAGGQQIPRCPVCTLRERLAAVEKERDAALAGQATWIKKAAEYNDKAREAEKYWRTVHGDARGMLDIAEANLAAERAARVQAEAELSRARELLADRPSMIVPGSYGQAWSDEVSAFLNPANTVPKETDHE